MSRARQRLYTLDIDPTCDIGCSLALWLRLHSASFSLSPGARNATRRARGESPGREPPARRSRPAHPRPAAHGAAGRAAPLAARALRLG